MSESKSTTHPVVLFTSIISAVATTAAATALVLRHRAQLKNEEQARKLVTLALSAAKPPRTEDVF